MRKLMSIAAVAALVLLFGGTDLFAAGPNGPVMEEHGFFYNYFYQWLRDDDGDGIPNCLDPDYVKPEDGTGYGKKNGDGDCDCDGVCDGTCDGGAVKVRIRTRTNAGQGHMHQNTYERAEYKHKGGE